MRCSTHRHGRYVPADSPRLPTRPPRPALPPPPASSCSPQRILIVSKANATSDLLPLSQACLADVDADSGTVYGRGTRRDLLIRTAAACALTAAANGSLLAGAGAAALVDEDISTAVFQSVRPSVASIAVVRPVGGVQVREVIGSGIVWDAAGPHVLTNFHLIPTLQGTSTLLEVTLVDTSTAGAVTVGAVVAGTDSIHDLAVLRLVPLPPQLELVAAAGSVGPAAGGDGDVDVSDRGGRGDYPAAAPGVASGELLPAVLPVRLGSSAAVRVGQSVYALGSLAPDRRLAPTWTLSAGLVSGLDRSIPSPVGARIYGVVQTDAVINAANSGGPLVDSFGRLVGLSTAMGAGRQSTGRGSGVNFALPVDLLRDLVPKIIVYGNPYGKK